MLELFAENPDRSLTLAEVTRGLGVHKATCHSMLRALTDRGWLRRDPARKTYHLGPELVRIGRAAEARRSALEFARSAMAELASTTRTHCLAFQPGEDYLTLVAQVRAPGGGGNPMALGTQLPMRPPYGAAIMAWADGDTQAAWLARTPADVRDRYRRAMGAVRRRGFAVGLHVLPDMRLLELAELVRRAEQANGTPSRVAALAEQLTSELMHKSQWFPVSLRDASRYHVSHVDAPILDERRRVAILLSLVPPPSPMTGAAIRGLGETLAATAAGVTAALAGTGA
jgi:DNA-binding IclR family transcriptional regulator